MEPRNAYAAQGVAIAFAEEKNYVQANMIFNKVKETLKDTSVSINMGHCYADQRDWVRAIQNVCAKLNVCLLMIVRNCAPEIRRK